MIDQEIGTEMVIKTFEFIQKKALGYTVLTDASAKILLIGNKLKAKLGEEITNHSLFDYYESIWVSPNQLLTEGGESDLIVYDLRDESYYRGSCEQMGDLDLFLWIFNPLTGVKTIEELENSSGNISMSSLVRRNVFLNEQVKSVLDRSRMLIKQMSTVNNQLKSINHEVRSENDHYKNSHMKMAEVSDVLQYNNQRLNMLVKSSNMIGFELNLENRQLFFHPKDALEIIFPELLKVESLNEFYDLLHDEDVDKFSEEVLASKDDLDVLFRLRNQTGDYKWLKLIGYYPHSSHKVLYGLIQDVNSEVLREHSIYESEGVQRNRISRTIHDQIAQWLVGLNFMMGSALETTKLSDENKREINGILQRVIQRSNGIIQALQVDLLEFETDYDGYKEMVGRLMNAYPSEIHFDWTGSHKIANFRISYQLFVIFQEALMYVMQKSENPKGSIHMLVEKSRVTLSVSSHAFHRFNELRLDDQSLQVILHKCKITNALLTTETDEAGLTKLIITIEM